MSSPGFLYNDSNPASGTTTRHIWMCKTRQVSIFKHGIFRNAVTIFGVFLAVTVILIIVYSELTEGVQDDSLMTGNDEEGGFHRA